MKIILSTLMALGVVLAPVAAPSVALAVTKVAVACPDDAPEAWKRAGGFCEQIQTLDTIGTEKGNGNKPACQLLGSAVLPEMINGRVHVATTIDPCCNVTSLDSVIFNDLPEGILTKSDAVEFAEPNPCHYE